MKQAAPKRQRCAIYTRKSTEHNLDLAFNSLDAQNACKPVRPISRARRMKAGRWFPATLMTVGCPWPCWTALPFSLCSTRFAGRRSTASSSTRSTVSPGHCPTSPGSWNFRRAQGVVRHRHPGVQHGLDHGPPDAQRAAVLRPVRGEVIGERTRDKIAASKRLGHLVWRTGPALAIAASARSWRSRRTRPTSSGRSLPNICVWAQSAPPINLRRRAC